MNFSCWSISLRAVAVDFGRHVEHRTLSQSSVSRSGEEAGPRRLRRGLQRKHLYISLADAEMIAVPGHGTLYDLPVYAGIAAELAASAQSSRLKR